MTAVAGSARREKFGVLEEYNQQVQEEWQDPALMRIDETLDGMESTVNSSPTPQSISSYPAQSQSNYYWSYPTAVSLPQSPQQEMFHVGRDMSNSPYITLNPTSGSDMYGSPNQYLWQPEGDTRSWDTHPGPAPNPNSSGGGMGVNNGSGSYYVVGAQCCGSEEVGLEEEQEQISVISYIRTEMHKLREQVYERRDAENALQHILTEKEQEIEHLKEELETHRSQHMRIQQGPVTVMFNIESESQDRSRSLKEDTTVDDYLQKASSKNPTVQQQRRSSQEEASVHGAQLNLGGLGLGFGTLQASMFPPAGDAYNLLPEDSASQHSESNPQSQLEQQVQQLRAELESKAQEVSQARSDARVLQKHIVSMSDKVMQLNTQVQQLRTLLALQQDKQEDTMGNLLTAREELDQRDTDLQDVSYLVHQIGRQVGITLPKDAENLQDICISLDSLSSTLSTWAPCASGHTQSTYSPRRDCLPPHIWPYKPPRLQEPQSIRKKIISLQTLLVLNSLLFDTKIKQAQAAEFATRAEVRQEIAGGIDDDDDEEEVGYDGEKGKNQEHDEGDKVEVKMRSEQVIGCGKVWDLMGWRWLLRRRRGNKRRRNPQI